MAGADAACCWVWAAALAVEAAAGAHGGVLRWRKRRYVAAPHVHCMRAGKGRGTHRSSVEDSMSKGLISHTPYNPQSTAALAGAVGAAAGVRARCRARHRHQGRGGAVVAADAAAGGGRASAGAHGLWIGHGRRRRCVDDLGYRLTILPDCREPAFDPNRHKTPQAICSHLRCHRGPLSATGWRRWPGRRWPGWRN